MDYWHTLKKNIFSGKKSHLSAVHHLNLSETRRGIMSKDPPSKNETLEALNFILSVITEHDKDLNKLVSELTSISRRLAETGELSSRFGRIENKIDNLQNAINNLLKSLSTSFQ